MPDALLTIPSLHSCPEQFIESENTDTSAAGALDRSSSSRSSTRQSMRTLCRKIARKSNAKRSSKKPSLNFQPKKSGARSQIPRSLLLTPSASGTSVKTHDSFRSSPLTSVKRSITTEEQAITSVVQRQRCSAILAYRERRPISQMDMNQICCKVQFPARDGAHAGKALMDGTSNHYSCSNNGSSHVQKMVYCNKYAYNRPKHETRMAGTKIFATIMLHAWRKRRDEVKRLMEEVLELKRAAIKAKNQLHVLNTLFCVEQKRNDELNCQLKCSMDDIFESKSSCESLTTSLISLKADNALLEQQVTVKGQECEGLNALLSQTKSDLFKYMTAQRELQASLSMEQRKVQECIDEIHELRNEAKDTELQLRNELQTKIQELSVNQKQLRDLQQHASHLHERREKELCEAKINDENMETKIDLLQNEVRMLNKCLENTLTNRITRCWQHSANCRRAILHMLQWMAFYLLPTAASPMPRTFPLTLTWDKVFYAGKR